MKFLSTIAIAIASIVLGANAAAISEAEAEAKAAWCSGINGKGYIGQPCWKKRDVPTEVKREAEPWCKYIGQSCPKKREAAPEADADAGNFCQGIPGRPYIGRPCPKKRDVEAVCSAEGMPCHKVKRAADAFAAAIASPGNFCQGIPGRPYIGRPCPKMTKRDAEAEAACYLPGAPCDLAKREAYALAAATADALPKAEAEAFYADASLKLRSAFTDFEGDTSEEHVSENAKREADAAWCSGINGKGYVGQPCWKAKRAAEAVAEALAEPEAGNFCQGIPGRPYIGRPCPKKREALAEAEAMCFAENGPCNVAKRSADALFEAAADTHMKF